jgi:hypothetical protein
MEAIETLAILTLDLHLKLSITLSCHVRVRQEWENANRTAETYLLAGESNLARMSIPRGHSGISAWELAIVT